ncbi:ATP-binding protein (plasmid) [Burkholderia pyrrocinia]|uniref:sensor histidine kinase n=1 Tax=Burkholderia pyrrocinia TaxID=60550 RepID=UPI0038B69B95
MDAFLHQPTGFRWRWYSSTFRFVTVYAVAFSISIVVLLGTIVSVTTRNMERETDVVMHWELTYFDALPDSALTAAINNRLEHEHMHPNYYGLFTRDGHYLAGDIRLSPANIKFDRSGVTLNHTLPLTNREYAPVVRAMATQRPDGNKLVLARDLTHILHIRELLINTLIISGLVCLGAGIVGGLIFSVRQMQRLKVVHQVTQRIAQGNLGQRLPIGGRDAIDMLSHLVNHMLEEIERLINEVKGVCDGIAHDLRTPLSHVHIVLAHVAEHAARYDDETLAHLIDQARTETNVLLTRFRAMLRIAEIGALQRREGFEMLQLGELVLEVGQLFEPLAESRSIQLHVRIDREAEIHGDRELLFEAFSNVLDNALKYTTAGGVVSLELNKTPHGPSVSVIDNGPGIAPEERQAVLEYRYRSARTNHLTGAGLGLSIVAAVVHVHDFSMRLGSANPGTRVTIDCWPMTLA